MLLRASVVVVISALLSLPALAQDGGSPDGGALDGGDTSEGDGGFSGDCTPACDGEVLRFCDLGQPVELDCTEAGATCGLLSEDWGFDCVLPPGAACEPGYADGLSRCDGAGDNPPSNCCVEEVCADPGDVTNCRGFLPDPPEPPESANPVAETPTAASCLGLDGCAGSPLGAFLPLLFGLRLLRRRQTRR